MDMFFDEVKEPTIVVINEVKQLVDSFRIVAAGHEEIDCMVKNMIFYTSSIPTGRVKKKYSTIFYGVDPLSVYTEEKSTQL
jgi:hypothetical protein